ncbi:hypothetical protein F2Q69_00014326 [Brassica cretica]|uniref:RNase H type-1 domain-containing protein n=1 Tax=Brassica cretica TaxID=69181 RepID=A0A8S9QZX5_BRACR|nr:hypothetical protein F2Q69_00014326 [Brassica cretica]
MEIGGTSKANDEVYDKEMMIEDQDDDLLGQDLMEMDGEGSKNVEVNDQMADKAIEKSRASSSHKSGGKSRIPVDGSWTASAPFRGCGWVWWDSGGNIQLLGTRNFNRRESALHSEVEALRWAMENMLQHSTCQSFGTDRKELIAMIKEPHA